MKKYIVVFLISTLFLNTMPAFCINDTQSVSVQRDTGSTRKKTVFHMQVCSSLHITQLTCASRLLLIMKSISGAKTE